MPVGKHTPAVQKLIDALRVLPSVGPKSAQRMAYQLLEKNREAGLTLASALQTAMTKVGQCQQCRTFCEDKLCQICNHPIRGKSSLLCVVASAADLYAIEQTGMFAGRYFVLCGQLSPLDGIGPQELGLDNLARQLASGELEEVILATNPTVEGEATAFYIAEMSKKYKVPVSRLAQGMPVGGELEYIDGSTLSHALSGRKPI